MTSKEVRNTFLDFFASKNHHIVQSAPMVVKGDPTLMFTNAGMNQFKNLFLGNSPIVYPRVADSQKCLRVSGKHNDLEEVGHDSYHHTMFEMLGNWSFGDYFKEDAIGWAWELLTKVYKLDEDRLYATIFEGYKDDNLDEDTEAKNIWLKYLPEERIILGNKHDNFWEMGDTGPCGPCSEIHIDLRDEEERKKVPGRDLVNKSDPLVIEIWNLVFMQYNRKANGSLESLPAKHVDTGMGLERLVMAINGFKSNYEGDLFQNIIKKISELSGKKYGKSEDVDIAMRVIADHLRAISFSIADGQLPSNVKAGYVIRRILRRAVRYGYTFLGFNSPFLCKLVPALIEEMGEAFPEISKQEQLITKVIKEEEDAFLHTLDKGIALINDILEQNKKSKVISGKDAFTLYDTFGFPLDLTELIASEKGYTIDLKEFDKELAIQKQRARNSAAVEQGDWVTIRKSNTSEFVGYDEFECDININRYRTIKTKGKKLFELVFDKTPFYAESGGQTGDTGIITSDEGEEIKILKTIKENNLSIHIANKIPQNPQAKFYAKIDLERRMDIARNHTATHLIDFALRQVLGKHVEQKGSSIEANVFRFDFSHFEKVSSEQLRQVERIVNNLIRANYPLEEYRNLPIEDAKKLGAIALFGEKYGDKVRVIKYGDSIEFCGGTHVSATGNIGSFKIISESAVAAGIRRIEATSGRNVEKMLESFEDTLNNLKGILRNNADITEAVSKIIADNETLSKKVEEIKVRELNQLKDKLLKEIKIINNINVITYNHIGEVSSIKQMAFEYYNSLENTVFAAAFEAPGGKACLTLMYTKDLVEKGLDASKDIRIAAKLIQGGGGGQKFLSTAGGKKIEGLNGALDKMVELATKQ